MSRLLLALLLSSLPFAGAEVLAADDPALLALDACSARLDRDNDVGLVRIEKRCPDLLKMLQAASWNALLPKDMRARRDEISAQGLRELAALVRESRAALAAEPRDTHAGPDPDRLTDVLASLGNKAQQGVTRWQRLKQWLQDKLQRRQPEEQERKSWLDRLGRQFQTSEGFARMVTYTGYVLVALLVLWIIASELRAAGLLGGAARTARREADRSWRRQLQLTDVLAAPLAERPGLLLRLLGEALTRANRLASAAGLPASELVRRAKLDSEADRAELARVAATAEAVRYAPRRPEEQRLETAVTSARSLLHRLTEASASLRRSR